MITCVSASGFALPPTIIYPRKKAVPDCCKKDALPGTMFTNSDNGWINRNKYAMWFDFFLKAIPPARPVLLIEDGHASHVTMEIIVLARANDIHLLCLPAHTTDVLQPCISVFKPFKSCFSKDI